MPFAVTHFLASAAVMKAFRFLRLDRGRLLSARELFLCAFLGILPDVDMLIQYGCKIFGIRFWPHRVFTHNIFVALALLGIGLLAWFIDQNYVVSKVFFLASAAWGVHVLLDAVFMGPVRMFAPLSWSNSFGVLSWTMAGVWNMFIAVDAILLVGWLFLRVYGSNR